MLSRLRCSWNWDLHSINHATNTTKIMEHRTDPLPNVIRRLELEAGTSNDILSDQDSRIVQQLLSEAKAKLGDLDHEILAGPSPVPPQHQHLLGEKILLHDRIERFRVALAPHKSIPPELLNHVFLLALDRGVTLPLRRHRSSAPWNISYVCSKWRQVALAEPRLWDTIVVDYSLTENHPRLNSIANAIVSRSGECGISVACTDPEATSICEDPTPSSLTMQRGLITTHIRRIHHLDISTSRSTLAQYLELPPLQFVSLESTTLMIRGRYHVNNILTDNPIALFSDARSLQKITLITDFQCRLFPKLLLVPWGQITDLVLRQVVIPHDMTLALLQQCANLVNCTLTLGDHSDAVLFNLPDMDNINPVAILHLRSLTLQIDITELGIYLLSSVSLPSLRALDIGPGPRYGVHPQALPQDALLSMLKRSGCTLDTFTCKFRNKFDLDRLLREMPDLRNLTLTARHVGTSTIEAMSRGELLPKLELIHCGLESVHPFLDFLEGSLSGVVRSEDRAYEGLMVVDVWGYNLTDRPGAEERIRELEPRFEERGKDVSIIIGSESDSVSLEA